MDITEVKEKLWAYLSDQLGETAIDSELNDILHIVGPHFFVRGFKAATENLEFAGDPQPTDEQIWEQNKHRYYNPPEPEPTECPLSLITSPVNAGDLLRTTNPYPMGSYYRVIGRNNHAVTLHKCHDSKGHRIVPVEERTVHDNNLMLSGPVWMKVRQPSQPAGQ